MSVEHTPGPWVINDGWLENEGGPYVDGQYLSVCMSETRLSDCFLIVGAPDLAKAAEEAKILIGARNDNLSEAARQSNINAAWHLLDKALAKATGAAA